MFLEEIRLSKKLGNHPNIVGIVGSIIVYEPSCLILEFVDGGDLLEFLHKQKDDPASTEIITQDDQVFFAWQIANGMVCFQNMILFYFRGFTSNLNRRTADDWNRRIQVSSQ